MKIATPASVFALSLIASLAACGVHRGPFPEPEVGRFDILIVNGTVVDGTGAPAFRADVGIVGDRIVAVSHSSLADRPAARVIDATGLVVAPGFIDLHAHIERLFEMPAAESHMRQGVTFALGGPDGGGAFPVGRWLDSANRAGLGINVGTLVGHNTVRRLVMGTVDRAPTAAELEQMRALVRQGMAEGAFGFSTGLIYVPGTYSNTDEVVALARVAADSGGIYTSHMRNEGRRLLESVEETIEIGRRAGIPVVITHAKASGKPNWGKSVGLLEAVDAARAAGHDVMLDQYPYTASSTGISVLVPSWALAGGDTAFARRVSDPALRDSIARGIYNFIVVDREGGDLEFAQFARVSWNRELEGKTLADWARMRGLQPSGEVGAELVIEAILNGGAGGVFHVMSEGDVRRIMAHPLTMIASDGALSRPGDGHPHPRAYGTFPRVLGRYVREQSLLSLEQAVNKMTWMPAERLGMRDRGRIIESGAADITIFDPSTVADRATYENPHQYPAGIPYVIVNGRVAVDRGEMTAERAGIAVERPRCEPPSCAVMRATRMR